MIHEKMNGNIHPQKKIPTTMLPSFNKNSRNSSSVSGGTPDSSSDNKETNDNDDYIMNNDELVHEDLPKDLEDGLDEEEILDEDAEEEIDETQLAHHLMNNLDEIDIMPDYTNVIGYGMVPAFLQNNPDIQQMRQDIRDDLEDDDDGNQFDIDIDTVSLTSSTLTNGSSEREDEGGDNVHRHQQHQPEGIFADDAEIDGVKGNRSNNASRKSSFSGKSRSNSIKRSKSNKSDKSGKTKNSKKKVNHRSPLRRLGILGSLLKLHQSTKTTTGKPGENNDENEQVEMQNLLKEEELEEEENTKQQGKEEEEEEEENKNKKNALSNNGSQRQKVPNFKSVRPKLGKATRLNKLIKTPRFPSKAAHQARITVHITNLLQKHRFIIRLCKALMLYGAPTHRLEEYMKMTSRVLELDGQFLYLPGCMVISFGDMTTRTSELQMVKCDQGVNLWKLHKVHQIYKNVIHDLISVEDANNEIDSVMNERDMYSTVVTVVFYALASAMVTPMAFGGHWVNLAISFAIGGTVGIFKFYLSPKSQLYSNAFEISSSIVVSFVGRALGSIPHSNICFGSVVQGSLALILPGYIILCGSLELQNKSIVAGSVRMFYSIIYSLFLSFGITLGSALCGWILRSKVSNETTCQKNIDDRFLIMFVPFFSTLMALINQAKWTQVPVMTFISCVGFIVSHFSGKHFKNATEFNSAMAAFVIGILGNLYSRLYKGLAVSAILPAIFVQVPSGIASKSSLLTGVESANRIVNSTGSIISETTSTNSLAFGMTMTQVSIGITVGLFASTLVVYPFGKKRTGIFTL